MTTWATAPHEWWVVASPPPACFVIQLPSPAYDRKLTNVNGVVKVKPGSGATNQKWIVQSVGGQVRIASAVGNAVLAVQNGGNAVGNLITLQPSGTEDHKLWTRVPLTGGLEAIVRKNSTYLIGSPNNWGNGDPNDAVTDIQLVDDPGYSFGSNKWQFISTACPTARMSAEEMAEVAPAAEDAESSQRLTAFPNPSGGQFDVQFYAPPGRPATLTVTDLAGREVWRKPLIGTGIQREAVRLPEDVAGMYLLILQKETGSQGGDVESTKIMVVK
ncbi:T9SS type A sorting domain-containing protein [Arundinibacter roseus]|uniref:T9SS type A sorting domain-containing protein n=1 Tax=Arundinibacter roseus TaxID=2070510 RepID=A0A4R4K2T8_9BACT|nr:T9SS type A sorting domain-containing protein [Arundinibacter roseus]TDB60872.1 T9SS type A sorting domain-containing protein [Arundinibacter roseus]